MKKLFSTILILSLLLSGNAYAKDVVTYECVFDRENYRYTINWYEDVYNDIILKHMKSGKLFLEDNFKSSVTLTVIEGERSYTFKGFKNNNGHLEHYLVFLDGNNILYAYLSASKFKVGKATEFEITSFDNALDKITKGICKEYK